MEILHSDIFLQNILLKVYLLFLYAANFNHWLYLIFKKSHFWSVLDTIHRPVSIAQSIPTLYHSVTAAVSPLSSISQVPEAEERPPEQQHLQSGVREQGLHLAGASSPPHRPPHPHR